MNLYINPLCYFLFSLFLFGCSDQKNDPSVILAEGPDESAGNVPCYIIETPSATYYLEKEGGGLSSMIDVDGIDWLGFHKDPGTQSKGEYRGFPNAIHKQDGSYFHARNAGTDSSASTVTKREANLVEIVFTSGNNQWEGTWRFLPTHCEFTMSKVSAGYHYWILYEGVPGGTLDKSDFWYSSKDESKHLIDEKQNDDLPGPEWIAFGDEQSPRMITLVSHEDDSHADRFYNMRDEMTVFGFGRSGGEKLLDRPLSFNIGFVESKDYQEVKKHVFTGLGL